MIVISTREFRAKQRHFLDLTNEGEDIVLKSRTSGSFRLVPVEKEDTVVKRDLMAELRGALQEVKDDITGKKKMKSAQSLIDEL